MTIKKPTSKGRDELGANERAILERIRWGPARRLATRMVVAKMRLQFTGWLQYLLPLPFIALIVLVGGLAWLLGAPRLGGLLLGVAGLLALVATFDIATTKWKIRLRERRPPPRDAIDSLDLLLSRRSCRSFQTRPMTEDDRASFLVSVQKQLSVPTLGGNTPRLEYIAAPLTVWPVVNASEFLVAIVPRRYDRMAVIDVGRTLQRVVVDATRMGLGTCWIGPGADHESIRGHLGDRFDPEADHIICVCAVGYPSRYIPLFIRLFTRHMSSARLSLDELFFADKALEHPLDTAAPPIDRFGPACEVCRWSPSSYNGQTTRAAIETSPDGEVSAVHFMAVTASQFYAPVALGIWCANWELSCEALGLQGTFKSVDAGEEALPRHDVTWLPDDALR